MSIFPWWKLRIVKKTQTTFREGNPDIGYGISLVGKALLPVLAVANTALVSLGGADRLLEKVNRDVATAHIPVVGESRWTYFGV